ncbi:hypothetical protein [Pseudomonas sp. PDM13]|uniref:hypothetical protein n=1 Tax=Pseudomonas sp. PDM13 TaxID=2769255 RepID=UPI0021DFF1B2|nr:hypothetical protein [Pseudomonas sp. PDM13]MCU9947555.1 hypothetical protein [Pseudomonas sp. PDM13]
MSDVKKAELRRAAEAAPKGEWTFDCAVPDRHFCAQVWDSEGKDLAVLAATEAGSYAAQHIAAANPSAVLSLLDDYDALLAKFDQAWKSASSESHAWAREYEARMLVMAERDQLRAELAAIRGQEAEDSETVRRICDLFGIGSKARTQAAIMVCVENTHKFAEMLDAIEAEFFMVPGEIDPDYPDDQPYDCLVNRWASTKAQYVEQFRDALRALPPQQPDAVSVPRELLERLTWPVLTGSDWQTFIEAQKELRALLSTRQAEEGE